MYLVISDVAVCSSWTLCYFYPFYLLLIPWAFLCQPMPVQLPVISSHDSNSLFSALNLCCLFLSWILPFPFDTT